MTHRFNKMKNKNFKLIFRQQLICLFLLLLFYTLHVLIKSGRWLLITFGSCQCLFYCTFYFFKLVLCAQHLNFSHDKKGGQQSCSGIFLEDEMDGTCNSQLLKFSKSIQNYLLSHKITITAEYLPSRLNVKADWESRNVTKSFDCKLLQKVFLKITKVLGTPSIDLFASRLCHQLLQYMAWKPVLQQIQYSRTGTNVCFPFPPSSLIGRVINKALRENVEAMILVTLTCQTQPWYTLLLRISVQRSLLLPALPNLFLNPPGRKTSSCENQVPKVSGVENYRRNLEVEGISSNAAKLISMSRRPGSIAGYESAWNKKVS